MKNCIVCNTPIPEGRLKLLPNTQTCVSHSTASKKVGMPITLGSGDHTYVELNIMDEKEYERIQKLKRNNLAF